jgi:nicotinate-nucleotide adenylyltransferase
MQAIGILGGTFDPIHHGHLRLALEMYESLGLAAVHLVPLYAPPHRPLPVASPKLRLEMVKAAAAGEPALIVDDRELRRTQISYTVDTLIALRAELGATPLCLILGMDAFVGLPSWNRWEQLIELAHIAVAHRPEAPALGTGAESAALRALLDRHYAEDPGALQRRPAGSIVLRTIPRLEIAASAIRERIARGGNARYLIPDAVMALIHEHSLYR